MDYPCAKFGNFIFSRFGFIVRTDRQTDRQTHRITDADDRYTDAITVGVSNEMQVSGTWMHPGGLAFVGLLKDSVCM